jgi:transcriptional regulator with XRE-family HTH domain
VVECSQNQQAASARSDVDDAAWKEFGEWIEQLRVRSGLTVGELAERADVSRVWLQVLRKGGRRIEGKWRPPNPKKDALARVARALDVPVEAMLARVGQDTELGTAEAETRDAASPSGDATSSVKRIRELEERVAQHEERVAQHEEELAELRRLLKRRARQADTG